MQEAKKEIIRIGRLLWDKGLTAGLSGNLSQRVDEESFLISATQTCLGLLEEKDVVLTSCNGEAIGEKGAPSSEWRLHAAIYKTLPECEAIVHVHAVYTNAFFLKQNTLHPRVLEAKFVLGEVSSVDQHTLNVENCDQVIAALQKNSIVVLRNHGSLAIGQNLFECFIKLQVLEEAAKTEALCKFFGE